MITISKEKKVGLFAVFTLVLLYAGVTLMKGKAIFSRNKRYHVIYLSAGGLGPGARVMVNGLQVGRVSEVSLIPEDEYKVKVEFTVRGDSNIQITDKTVARLEDNGLLGGKRLVLDLKEIGEPLPTNTKVRGEVSAGLQQAFIDSTLPILKDIRNTSNLINQFTFSLLENQHKITAAFYNLEQTTESIRTLITGNQENFDKTVKNVTKIITAFSDENYGLGTLLERINAIAKKAEELKLERGLAALNEIIVDLESKLRTATAVGTNIGQLMYDGELYKNVNKTLSSLEKLMADLKKHPSKYVNLNLSIFGNKRRVPPAKKSLKKP